MGQGEVAGDETRDRPAEGVRAEMACSLRPKDQAVPATGPSIISLARRCGEIHGAVMLFQVLPGHAALDGHLARQDAFGPQFRAMGAEAGARRNWARPSTGRSPG